MSGYTADVIAHQGVPERGMFFIPKPFSAQELSTKIREVMARSS
jgi:two-component system, cell cycle sensor histidine kinase and response regulator CckA